MGETVYKASIKEVRLAQDILKRNKIDAITPEQLIELARENEMGMKQVLREIGKQL